MLDAVESADSCREGFHKYKEAKVKSGRLALL